MNTRKQLSLIILLLLIFILSGCQTAIVSEEVSVLVETRMLETETKSQMLTYLGFVEPSELKKYSFLVGGELQDLLVSVGDYVYPGDPLMLLEDTKYQLNESAGNAQLNLAGLESQKAEDALQYAKDLHTDLESLFQQGAISKSSYDEGKLNYEISQKNYEQSKRTYSQALASLRLAQDTLDDTILVSNIEGIIGGIFYEEGELVSPGYPAIIVHSKQMEISIGISIDDVPYFIKDQTVTIKVGDVLEKGNILEIASLPDPQSRTYEVRVALTSPGLAGQSAKVTQEKDQLSGIWLDINEIRNDGEDYVYVASETRALRRNISLHEISDRMVRVEGITAGELLITRGDNLLDNGMKLTLHEDGETLE
jgi:RND family efflux transporter MFP subunit